MDAAFSYLKERFLGRERRTSAQRRAEWGEGCVRTLNTLKFLCLCSVSLIQVLVSVGEPARASGSSCAGPPQLLRERASAPSGNVFLKRGEQQHQQQ